MPKYLIHMGICGFGNQLLGFKEACLIAKYTNRIMVEPIFLPHGTIKSHCKKYYTFSNIFNIDHFKSVYDIVNIEDISNITINNVYNIRHINDKGITDSYYNLQKEYYGLTNVKFKSMTKQYITSVDDLQEINDIEDEILVLLGTFNTIKLSTCSKNGCLNNACKLNPVFFNDYNEVCKSLIFSPYIKSTTQGILNDLQLKPKDYCAFHLRTQDLCSNTLFKDSYNGYTENSVYQSIVNYLFESNYKMLVKKIFVCLPPQALEIHDIEIFNGNSVCRLDHTKYSCDSFILSIIELNICELSQILIYSPTNTPHMKKEHTRSSFMLHTMDLRRINNSNSNDVCINTIYNKLSIENIKIVEKTNKRVISTSLYGNKDIYNYGLLLNYNLMKIIFPGWILRVYIDSTTNMDFIAKVKNNDNIEIIKINSLLGPMYYRFFPISDPNVEMFISRDLDSIITYYEKNMITEWIDSDKQLHLIHEVLPGHRHTIMGGMFGFKKTKSQLTNNNETPSYPLDKNKCYYYSPWKSKCYIAYNKDYLVISPHNNNNAYAKVLKIFKDNFLDFYNEIETICLWDNTTNLPIQKIGQDIKVIHRSGNHYFRCTNYTQDNSGIYNIYNAIINYNIQVSRNVFIYGDDQLFLSQFLKDFLNKDKCMDHNNTSKKYNYSKTINNEFTPISTILKNLKDCYVGHRVDTKALFIENFQ